MGNCLVTQLKESVNNDSLKKLGVMRFSLNVTSTSTQYKFYGAVANKSYLKIISGPSGGKITSNTGSIDGTEFYLKPDLLTYTFNVTGTYVIEITDKYNVSALDVVNSDVDLSDLYYSELTIIGVSGDDNVGDLNKIDLSNILDLKVQNCSSIIGDLSEINFSSSLRNVMIVLSPNIKGDISAFAGKTSLRTLAFNNNKLTGSLSSILDCTSITNLQLNNSLVSGNIADLMSNGNLVMSGLKTLSVLNTPNLTKNAADVTDLRNLGVTVYV